MDVALSAVGGQPGELLDVERLAAGLRVDPRRPAAPPRRPRPTRPSRRARPAASCGAARTRRRPRRRPRPGRPWWPAAAGGSRRTRPESTFGAGQKTRAADRAGPAHVGVPGGLHRRHAVRPASRAARRAGRRPRPAPSPARVAASAGGRAVCSSDRHGDVVRQVRDQRGRRRAGQLGEPQRVAVTTVEPAGVRRGRAATVAGSSAASTGSISTATTRCGLQQRQRQRAEPGADLDHHVVGPQPGGPHDAAHGVRVDDEVLAELLGRPDAERGRRARGRRRVPAARARRRRRSPSAEQVVAADRPRPAPQRL